MREIASRNIAIIFITHRLDEVMNAADTITILRDGKLVAVHEKKDTSLVEMASLMIGRGEEGMISIPPRQQAIQETVALKVRGLTVDMPGEAVHGIDLDVYQGEILGIGGLAGQGKVGLPNGIMGLYPAQGEVRVYFVSKIYLIK